MPPNGGAFAITVPPPPPPLLLPEVVDDAHTPGVASTCPSTRGDSKSTSSTFVVVVRVVTVVAVNVVVVAVDVVTVVSVCDVVVSVTVVVEAVVVEAVVVEAVVVDDTVAVVSVAVVLVVVAVTVVLDVCVLDVTVRVVVVVDVSVVVDVNVTVVDVNVVAVTVVPVTVVEVVIVPVVSVSVVVVGVPEVVLTVADVVVVSVAVVVVLDRVVVVAVQSSFRIEYLRLVLLKSTAASEQQRTLCRSSACPHVAVSTVLAPATAIASPPLHAVLVQMGVESNSQPVDFGARSSSTSQSRAPAVEQIATASAYVASLLHPPGMPRSDSPHTWTAAEANLVHPSSAHDMRGAATDMCSWQVLLSGS